MKTSTLLLSITFLVLPVLLIGQKLDSTFSDDGKHTYEYLDENFAYASAIQTDDKLITLNKQSTEDTLMIIRFLPNGSLDSSFGTNGVAKTFIADAFPENIAIQPDGKILITGFTYPGFTERNIFVARYQTNGVIDNSFGTNGISIIDLTPDIEAKCVRAKSDGSIILGGLIEDNSEISLVVVQLDSDGTVDNSFGVNGIFATPNNGLYENMMNDLIILDDESIIFGGRLRDSMVIGKLATDGSIDPSFANQGYFSFLNDFCDRGIVALTLSHDGHILALGDDFGLYNILKIDKNTGSPITTFGNNGLTTMELGIGYPEDIVTTSNGKIYSIGNSYAPFVSFSARPKRMAGLSSGAPFSTYFVIQGFKVDGTIDSTFGIDGAYWIDPFPDMSSSAVDLNCTSHDKLYGFGSGENNGISTGGIVKIEVVNCPNELKLRSPEDDLSSGTHTFEANTNGGIINARNMASGTAEINFQAPIVELDTGFQILSSAVLNINNQGCTE